MDLDANVQKILQLLGRKWKIIVVFALLGALLAYVYTANFTTLTYSSTVEFLAYAVDTEDEMSDSTSSTAGGDAVRTSNTSKMNYAMKMLNTYVEILQTTSFYQEVATELNKEYGTVYNGTTLKRAIIIEAVEDTSMFKMTVTTESADLSYQIASQLSLSVPARMEKTNSGLVLASVEDAPVRASSAVSLGYPKKCLIGAMAGIVIAAAYVILRDLLDVRIKGSDNLAARYSIPVLGSVPDFGKQKSKSKRLKGDED